MKSQGIVQKWTWYRQGQGHWIKLPMEREGAEHVAQSTESLRSRQESWVQVQHHMNRAVVFAYNSGTLAVVAGGSKVQGYPRVSGKFQASLECVRLCLKENSYHSASVMPSLGQGPDGAFLWPMRRGPLACVPRHDTAALPSTLSSTQ